MTFHLAHRIELIPNNKQRSYFVCACGCARFAHNWALDQWKKDYEKYQRAQEIDPEQKEIKAPNQFILRRKLNVVKKEKFPWMLEVTKCAVQYAIMDLGQSFENFFRDSKKFHYPKKRKKFIDDHFSITNDQFKVKDSRIHIPKLGWVRMRESLRFTGCKMLRATVSRKADRWFVSIACELTELTHLPQAQNQGVCGVDLGIKSLAVLSDGQVFEGPKSYSANLKRLRRVQRSLSRKQKGSKNRAKQKVQVQKLHARIANIRNDALHKLTSYLTSHYHTIVIEDLNVSGMLKNHHLARCVADMGFFEFRRQLEYKAELRGNDIVLADRFYPSSKTCHVCGYINSELTLADRQWRCPQCETELDRDLNAAINLKNLAASSAVTACGERSSGSRGNSRVKLLSGKQEGNSKK